MDDQHPQFSVGALIEHGRTHPIDRDFTSAYLTHLRRAMATTQREIDEAMINAPNLQDTRL